MQNFKQYYQIISCFFFSLLGLQIKIISSSQNIETIVFYRSLLGIIIIIPFLFFVKNKSLFANKNLKIHFLRSLFGMSAMYFGYKALTLITLSQASTIGFTKVFFTTIFAVIFFKEKISISYIIFVLFGFTGVYLICLPDEITNYSGMYMSLFSAICVSGGIISVSYLSKKDNTFVIMFFHSLISTFGFFLIFKHDINFEISTDLFFLVLITLTALLGQFFNAESYKIGETNKIVAMSYSRIFFSTLLGYFVFDEKINFLTLIGILIIIITTFFTKRGVKLPHGQGNGFSS
tara:strand:- start:336 stop:1208 length:873 start_codon:yes stop_codon:yes gene_type:complete